MLLFRIKSVKKVLAFFLIATFVLANATLEEGKLPFVSSTVRAQSTQDLPGSDFQAPEVQSVFEVSPVINQLVMDPGEKKTYYLTVENLSSIPIPMKAYSRAFLATNEEGEVDFINQGKDPNAVQNWFNIKKPDFILQPFQPIDIEVEIQVPDVVRAGGHYATVFFESLVPEDVLSSNSLFLSSRIGALFFFVISGDIVEDGEIVNFGTDNNFYTKGPVQFNISFKNKGNVDLTPQSEIVITDFRGNEVAKLEDNGLRTLPESTRKWDIDWDRRWLWGKYTVNITTFLQKDVLNEVTVPLETTYEFYAFPVFEFTTAVVSFVLFFYIFVLKRKNLGRVYKVLTTGQYDTKEDEHRNEAFGNRGASLPHKDTLEQEMKKDKDEKSNSSGQLRFKTVKLDFKSLVLYLIKAIEHIFSRLYKLYRDRKIERKRRRYKRGKMYGRLDQDFSLYENLQSKQTVKQKKKTNKDVQNNPKDESTTYSYRTRRKR